MNQSQWQTVKERLRAEVGEAAFRSWLQPVDMFQSTESSVQLSVPTKFMRSWINNHYGDRIRALVRLSAPQIKDIELVIAAADPAAQTGATVVALPVPAAVPRTAPSNSNLPAPVNFTGESSNLASNLDPRFTFDNFIVGKSNELAFAAARRVADSEQVTFNPLFLYGGVGLGKTHLMHAIAWHILQRHPGRRVVYLSAEKFMYQFVRALRYKDTMAFKEQFRSVDVLMIDDVQFISGKDSTQEEFFHTFNALVDQNRQVIISADKSPSDLEGMEDRLKSRLGWGLVADIHPTTFELRLGILQAKAENLGAAVPQEVLEFLASKISSNVRELEGALNRLAASTTFVGAPITLESTKDLLKDLLRTSERRVTIEEIQRIVAEHFNIRVTEMASARRSRSIARPRQIAMFLAKMLTTASLPEIGRKFGGRDHTTVMHGLRTVEDMLHKDPIFAEDVQILKKQLMQ